MFRSRIYRSLREALFATSSLTTIHRNAAGPGRPAVTSNTTEAKG